MGGLGMSEYTPTTAQIKEKYVEDTIPIDIAEVEFDRWLAAHDTEVRNATLEEAALISLEMEANQGDGYYGHDFFDVATTLRAKRGANDE
jgi:hypothetical protein